MRDPVPVAALVQPADLSAQRLVHLDAKVDAAEGDGILARWEFGRELLAERVGKQLPAGRLDEIAEKLGKSRSELQYRVQFAETYATDDEVSTAVDTLKSWTEIRESLSESVPRTPRLAPESPPLPTETFNVLYADPPWRYEHAPTKSRAIENQYPTLTLDEIKDMGTVLPAAPDSVLFMWATSPKLNESLEVVEAWGFNYRTCMVWVKDKIGMGYYARQQHELLLVATRGAPGVPAEASLRSSVVNAPRGRHSEKPAVFYELIESLYPGFRYLEMFARARREGWAAWGNEVAA